MALMALQLAATDLGYGCCGIGALANYGDLVAEHLGLPIGEMVVCGLALGRADPQAAVNGFETARDPLDTTRISINFVQGGVASPIPDTSLGGELGGHCRKSRARLCHLPIKIGRAANLDLHCVDARLRLAMAIEDMARKIKVMRMVKNVQHDK